MLDTISNTHLCSVCAWALVKRYDMYIYIFVAAKTCIDDTVED